MNIRNTLLLLAFPSLLSAQQLERHILSAAGDENHSTNISLEWTLGELAVENVSNANITLTQGFHQPSVDNLSKAFRNKNLQTWPNPVSNILNVRLNTEEENLSLSLTDINGRVLKLITASSAESLVIDMNNFTNGIYFLSLRTSKGELIQSAKVCKIN